MFCRLQGGLPIDPTFPEELSKLGYCLNDKAQLRSIEDQERVYKFPVTTNVRYNELYREAIYKSVRSQIIQRVVDEDLLQPLYLPQLVQSPPDKQTPHLPILISDNLKEAKRVIFLLQESYEQWLCWSWRDVEGQNGIENGSVVGLARAIKEDSSLGLVMLNPCQLLYSYDMGTAMSEESWDRRGRESIVHSAKTILDINRIPGNETPAEHVSFVFKNLLSGDSWINPAAKVEVIGINAGCEVILQFLSDNWDLYGERICAVALANCPMVPTTVQWKPFIDFMAKRGCEWHASVEPENTFIGKPDDPNATKPIKEPEVTPTDEPEDPWWPTYEGAAEMSRLMNRVLCPIVSCGPVDIPVEAFGMSYKRILEWLGWVANALDYENAKDATFLEITHTANMINDEEQNE